MAPKKKKEIDSLKADMKGAISIAKKELQGKAWNLEDDTDEEEEDELNQLHRNQRSTRKGQRRRFRSGRKPFGKRRYFRKRKERVPRLS